jgi:hypothetical protein
LALCGGGISFPEESWRPCRDRWTPGLFFVSMMIVGRWILSATKGTDVSHRPRLALSETRRILKPSGQLVVGYLERLSPWGMLRRFRGTMGHAFWRQVRFYHRREVEDLMTSVGYENIKSRGTLFGSFVLVSGKKTR